ncbi:MAG: hypothetical protein ACXIVF_04150 [Rhizobiaceae bacterium]
MTELQPGFGEPEGEPFGHPAQRAAVKRDTVLIVSGVRITTTVIARAVTMAGFKSATADPDGFEQAACRPDLAAIILDDELHLASRIADRTILAPEGQPAKRPFVILMATPGLKLDAGLNSPHCDAVLSKPILSDRLCPLLFDIRQRLA